MLIDFRETVPEDCEVGSFVDSRRTFLFVFLDEGILDGYTWLSSLPAEMRAPGPPAPAR